MSERSRLVLFLTFLGAFVLWLGALIFYLFPMLIAHISDGTLDAITGILAGLGVGGITQLFGTLLTLAWQFYWRRSPGKNGGTS